MKRLAIGIFYGVVGTGMNWTTRPIDLSGVATIAYVLLGFMLVMCLAIDGEI